MTIPNSIRELISTDPPTPPRYAQEPFNLAGEPKRLVWIETINHIQLYDQEPMVTQASDQVGAWFTEHLGASRETQMEGRRLCRPPSHGVRSRYVAVFP